MGCDATSGERNTTGHDIETQALTFAGSTARGQKGQKLERACGNSRGCDRPQARSGLHRGGLPQFKAAEFPCWAFPPQFSATALDIR